MTLSGKTAGFRLETGKEGLLGEKGPLEKLRYPDWKCQHVRMKTIILLSFAFFMLAAPRCKQNENKQPPPRAAIQVPEIACESCLSMPEAIEFEKARGSVPIQLSNEEIYKALDRLRRKQFGILDSSFAIFRSYLKKDFVGCFDLLVVYEMDTFDGSPDPYEIQAIYGKIFYRDKKVPHLAGADYAECTFHYDSLALIKEALIQKYRAAYHRGPSEQYIRHRETFPDFIHNADMCAYTWGQTEEPNSMGLWGYFHSIHFMYPVPVFAVGDIIQKLPYGSEDMVIYYEYACQGGCIYSKRLRDGKN